MAHSDGITYSDQELESLADLCFDLFGADFDHSGPFWARLESAYLAWWDGFYENVDEELRPVRPRMNKDWVQGGTFFWHQLKKSWHDSTGKSIKMPKLNIQTQFFPAVEDLF